MFLMEEEDIMFILNDEHRQRAGIGSLSKRCQYCSEALAAYPDESQLNSTIGVD
jgi:hypothetical protein